ncbi:unnamed protein product, partial [Porites evermanni]
HLGQCGKKAVQRTVRGRHAVFRRKDFEDHMATAASSHMILQAGEVEWLRRILYHKLRYNTRYNTITLQEGNTISFRWEVDKFNLYTNSTIASPCFVSPERHRYLQLQSAVHPATAKIRVVLLNGNESKAVTLPTTDLEEGEMVKANGDKFKIAWLNNDELKVKFIITSYSYNETTP